MPSYRWSCLLLLAASPALAQDMPLSQVLLSGEDWKQAAPELKQITALTADREGNVFLADADRQELLRLDPQGKLSSLGRLSGRVTGLALAPDGRLAACQPDERRVVRIGTSGPEEKSLVSLAAQELVFTRAGVAYCTVPAQGAVYLVTPGGEARKAAGELGQPTGICLWPDEGTLLVADGSGRHLWTFRVEPDGTLSSRERYYALRHRPGVPALPGGIVMDAANRAYVASRAGIQVFDPTGRLSGVLLPPRRALLTHVTLAGARGDVLHALASGTLYVRRTRAQAAR